VGRGEPDALAKVETILRHEISTRLHFLVEVGLGYLTLDRPAPTLSGGELQRARLATQLGGGLRGVCYVLDEPTLGLHPRDTQRLLDALRVLQRRGNSLLVVEHDEAVMRAADYLVDLGPEAGRNGGRLLAAGKPDEVVASTTSVTAPFLRGERRVGGEPALPITNETPRLVIRGAREHNLANVDVAFPLGRIVAVTGVSGSGKSSLVHDILARGVRRHLGLATPPPGAHEALDGLDAIDKLIEVDQRSLGRSSRSSAATYTGLFDEIRKLFAQTRTAKIRGYKANRFSFNVRGGRCEVCQGQGEIEPGGPFLPELTVPCPGCHGSRFNTATLEVRFKGKSIADVLAMTVAEARELFAAVPAAKRLLDALDDVGLGYLTLGQPASRLSGGEAQRVKLATELARAATGRTLFLLDEPTSGLHRIDVARLLSVLRRLVAEGNTVIVIEHQLDVIAAADWVIDLGPDAGEKGGCVVVAGPPSALAECAASVTGKFLKPS
jgi:excinuclease ABC subunit A